MIFTMISVFKFLEVRIAAEKNPPASAAPGYISRRSRRYSRRCSKRNVMKDKERPILVSACLAGESCRYDGSSCAVSLVETLVREGRAITFCPEVEGGLATPRPAAEIVGGDGRSVLRGEARVLTVDGDDVTSAFFAGAGLAATRALAAGCRRAILKSNSPSCAVTAIFDGSFSAKIKPGIGVAAAALAEAGIYVETGD